MDSVLFCTSNERDRLCLHHEEGQQVTHNPLRGGAVSTEAYAGDQLNEERVASLPEPDQATTKQYENKSECFLCFFAFYFVKFTSIFILRLWFTQSQ